MEEEEEEEVVVAQILGKCYNATGGDVYNYMLHECSLPPELEGDERLRNIEPRMVELITNEVTQHRNMIT